MTVYSQNGYSANQRSVIASYTVPHTSTRVALRKGDCSVVLLNFAAWFDKFVEDIDGGELDDWGYAERNVRGSTTVVSNHASGTAIDLNANRHPLGKRGTFTRAQTLKIRAKLKEYDGVLRWGGDYQTRCDEMHVEINAGAAAVRIVADRIRKYGQPKAPAKKTLVVPVKPLEEDEEMFIVRATGKPTALLTSTGKLVSLETGEGEVYMKMGVKDYTLTVKEFEKLDAVSHRV